MVLEEKYRKIICEMTKIALVDVRAYFTDFTSFDIPQLCEYIHLFNYMPLHTSIDVYPELLWCIRETGTHLIFPEYGKDMDHFSDIININDRYFYINLENETEFKEITYNEAQEIVKNWKEI